MAFNISQLRHRQSGGDIQPESSIRRSIRNLQERLYVADAGIRTFASSSDEGAATAEYAVVLVAATGFAGILVALLKSDVVKTLLSNIVKKALNV